MPLASDLIGPEPRITDLTIPGVFRAKLPSARFPTPLKPPDVEDAPLSALLDKVTTNWPIISCLMRLGVVDRLVNPAGTEAIINGYFNPPPPVGISAGISVPDLIKKETNSAFELGVKGRVFNSMNFEVAGFLTNVRNMQFFEFFVGDFGLLSSTSNIDKVQIYGVEASFDYRISPLFKLFVNGNYTQSEIKRNTGRPYTIGNKSPATPDFTINGGIQMNAPIADRVELIGRVDFRVVGPTPFHTVQRNTTPTIFGLPATYDNSTRDTFATVNARLGVDIVSFSISAFATNLFNKQYVEDVVIAPEFGGDFIAGGALRRFGVDVSYKF